MPRRAHVKADERWFSNERSDTYRQWIPSIRVHLWLNPEKSGSGSSDHNHVCLMAERQREDMKTNKSEELFRKALKLLPGGVDSPVRAFRAVGGAPLFIERG